MRYILDDNGYIESVSCNHIECNNKGCTEYTGSTPAGYDNIEQWATTANIRAYKIVDGELIYDLNRDVLLQVQWERSPRVVIETVIWEATSTEPELGSYGILERDFSAYKYVDVYFRAHGVQSSETAGNGISNVLRIDLGTPSTFPIITKNGVTYHYGASNMYPDAQFFVGVTNDPGFFIEGAFIDWHKKKLMVGNIGYYIIASDNISMAYGDTYEKVYKVVGYL